MGAIHKIRDWRSNSHTQPLFWDFGLETGVWRASTRETGGWPLSAAWTPERTGNGQQRKSQNCCQCLPRGTPAAAGATPPMAHMATPTPNMAHQLQATATPLLGTANLKPLIGHRRRWSGALESAHSDTGCAFLLCLPSASVHAVRACEHNNGVGGGGVRTPRDKLEVGTDLLPVSFGVCRRDRRGALGAWGTA